MSRPIGRWAGRGYRPIGDYAIIGDAHTAALVATDGSIDWLCWPRFDGPAVFCRLLDAQRGGWFRVGPTGEHAVSRTYAGDTNVLTTTFRSGSGAVRLTDFMPARQRGASAAGEDIEPSCQVLRLVEGLSGEMEMEVEFRPTFDYGRAETALAVRPGGAVARANGATLILDNAAAGQRQLDVYGEVLDAASLHVEYLGRPGSEIWGVLWRLADQAAARWREPDQGIWEVRGGPRHFLYSKLLCWVALDRAIRLAERAGLADGRPARWRRTRAAICRPILTRGYDSELGAFTQVLGERALDASALVVPLLGFLPATDPRVRSTVERIQERLTSQGLVYRYLADDGLPGGEATFALCSFWLVDNLALAGPIDEARALFERITGYANDVGLLAEEIDPASGELLGNYPQGFSHLALIRSALAIASAEDGQPTRRAKRSARAA